MSTNSKDTQSKKPSRAVAKKADVPAKVDRTLGRVIHKVSIEDGKLTLAAEEGRQADLDTAFATGSRDFVAYSMCQLANLIKKKDDEDLTIAFNAALAFIRSIAPANELEAVIAAQMFATHHLSMEVMRRATNADMIPQFEANGNMATKLQRTFLAQLDSLGKHRRGGKQIVEHVHVAAGGQAVIANTVNTGGGAQ
jgi:hypothetical protein